MEILPLPEASSIQLLPEMVGCSRVLLLREITEWWTSGQGFLGHLFQEVAITQHDEAKTVLCIWNSLRNKVFNLSAAVFQDPSKPMLLVYFVGQE